MGESLVEFLRARLDEDASVAKKATPGRWKLWGMTVMADTGGDGNVDHATDVAHTFSTDDTGSAPRTFDADHIRRWDPARVLAEVEAKRRIIDWHENWPVLVEAPQKIEETDPADLNSMTLRMSRQIAWMTEQEYRNRFGSEPPTAPILRLLAQPYADHPDFDPEWKL